MNRFAKLRPAFSAGWRAVLCLVALFVFAAWAQAHPVAQGSMKIHMAPGMLEVSARVANEQVFVAAAFGDKPAADLDAAFQAHGTYLLQKIEFRADEQVLTGRVEKVTPPTDKGAQGFTVYELRYPLPAGATPRQIVGRQTVLNEIPFAPGNMWEATYFVEFSDGPKVLTTGLFTHLEPLALTVGEVSNHSVFRDYFVHGFRHILEGWDHLLFMAALVLATRSIWELLKVVTAFTLAHTITLVLSVLNLFRLDPSIVEPMIALSIIVVAVQNVWKPGQSHGKLRLALAFGFGLFHGLGFAGGLMEAMAQMQGAHLGQALIAFSLGVEIGHQVVVLPIFFGMALARSAMEQPVTRERFSLAVLRYGSVAIAVAGAFYLNAALHGA